MRELKGLSEAERDQQLKEQSYPHIMYIQQ